MGNGNILVPNFGINTVVFACSAIHMNSMVIFRENIQPPWVEEQNAKDLCIDSLFYLEIK